MVLTFSEQSPPEDTITLNRSLHEPSYSAPSEFQPQQESDSDRERKADTMVWKKASQTLQQRQKPKARKFKKPTLKPIVFLDGDDQLRDFPKHLRTALQANCDMLNSTTPTCTRNLTCEKISKSSGREAFFQARQTGERLLQAKFKYGNRKQIVVVKEPTGKTINNGRAVIITGLPGCTDQPNQGGTESYNQSNWQIWGSYNIAKQVPVSEDRIVRLIKRSTDTRIAGVSANASIEISSPFRPLDHDDRIIDSESDSDVPLSNYRRRADKVEALSTPTPKSTFVPWQPQDPWTPIPSSTRSTTYTPTKSNSAMSNFNNVSPTATPQNWLGSRFKATSPISNTSGSPSAHLYTDKLPNLVFKTSPESSALRTKSASICDTVGKLFAQARMTGIITKSSCLLNLLIVTNNAISQEIQLVRGDAEDFESFMQHIKLLKESSTEILVLPGDE